LLPIGVKQELLVASNREGWLGLFKGYVAAAEKAGDPVRMPIMEGANHSMGSTPRRQPGRR
jgi:hypothetical protein